MRRSWIGLAAGVAGLLWASGVVPGVFATLPPAIDAVRGGALNTNECKKPCEDKHFVVNECWYRDSGQECKTNACIATTFYYAACKERTFTSDPRDCKMKDDPNAVTMNKVFRSTSGLLCNDSTPPGPRAPLPGYPGETTCQAGYPVNGKCELGSCPGVDVDEVDGVRNIWNEVRGNRKVCDNS